MKIALREAMAPGKSLADKLAWLAQMGIEGIELEDAAELPAAELEAAFAGSPVEVANVPGSTALLDPDPATRRLGMALTRERLDLARRLGAVGVLLVPQFNRNPGLPDLTPLKSRAELEGDLLVEQLKALAPVARDAGVSLYLEPLNRYEARVVNRVEQGVAFGERVGREIGVMADFFHMNIEEADIAASIRAGGERIVHVHAADSNRLQPGRGHLDFRPGFAALKEIGYDGFIGIECRLAGPVEEAVREAATVVRDVWAAA